MASVSSHVLDSVFGTHAGGIKTELFRLDASGTRARLFNVVTDDGGRLSEQVTLTPDQADVQYEMVFHSGDYFDDRPIPQVGNQILREVVIRFSMPEPDGRYHVPLMLAPNSYSVWWSG